MERVTEFGYLQRGEKLAAIFSMGNEVKTTPELHAMSIAVFLRERIWPDRAKVKSQGGTVQVEILHPWISEQVALM